MFERYFFDSISFDDIAVQCNQLHINFVFISQCLIFHIISFIHLIFIIFSLDYIVHLGYIESA